MNIPHGLILIGAGLFMVYYGTKALIWFFLYVWCDFIDSIDRRPKLVMCIKVTTFIVGLTCFIVFLIGANSK